MSLRVRPITLREANAYIAEHHRHHRPARGCLFCIAVVKGEQLCGVAIVGRPVARMLQDGVTAEVTRLCTDGARNACSMLYGAAWRACRAIGYRRLVTYTLTEEGGASLRGAGWRMVAELPPRAGWDSPARRRDNGEYLSGDRMRWEVAA